MWTSLDVTNLTPWSIGYYRRILVPIYLRFAKISLKEMKEAPKRSVLFSKLTKSKKQKFKSKKMK